MNKYLLVAYRYLTNNWVQIQGSRVCGCCTCLQMFMADEVVAWTGLDFKNMDDPEAIEKQTALCPRCGSETVLGDKSGCPLTAEFLGEMNEAWLQRTQIRAPKPKPKPTA